MVERFKFRAGDVVGFTDGDGVRHYGFCVGFYAYNGPALKGKQGGGAVRVHTYDVKGDDGYRYRIDEDELELMQSIDEPAPLPEPGSERERIKKAAAKIPLGDMYLPARAHNVLLRAGCETAWDVIRLARDAERLALQKGCGKTCIRDILSKLDAMLPGWDNRWKEDETA